MSGSRMPKEVTRIEEGGKNGFGFKFAEFEVPSGH